MVPLHGTILNMVEFILFSTIGLLKTDKERLWGLWAPKILDGEHLLILFCP